jgi:tetratricopeptide (TPR) repeat protein
MIFDLTWKKGSALGNINPKRLLADGASLNAWKKFSEFDFNEVENGAVMLLSWSALFSWLGISNKISAKVIEFVKENVKKEDVKYHLWLNFMEAMLRASNGRWKGEFNEQIVHKGLGIGELFATSNYIVFEGWNQIQLGNFSICDKMLSMLKNIGDQYDYANAKRHYYELYLSLLLKNRKLDYLQHIANDGITFVRNVGHELCVLSFLGLKAQGQVLENNLSAATETLNEAEKLYNKIELVPPGYYSNFQLALFKLSLKKFENMICSKSNKLLSKYRKVTKIRGEKAIRLCKKVASDRTETYRLMGVFHWTNGNHDKAFRWWEKSISVGRQLSALPELSRTYMEVGKRLMESKSKYKELDGLSGIEYLKESQKLFETMGMQWDLIELEKIATFS